MFPENKNTSSESKKGIEINKFSQELSKLVNGSIKHIISCINHIDPKKITWEEFLKYLQKEGERRAVITNTKMYNVGPKRLRNPKKVFNKYMFDQ